MVGVPKGTERANHQTLCCYADRMADTVDSISSSQGSRWAGKENHVN